MTGTVTLRMTQIEGAQLRRLVADFRTLLTVSDGALDSAVDRLTPSAYPDYRTAAEEFRSATRDSLLERRVRDAERVEQSLPTGTDHGAAADPLSEFGVELTGEETDAWLRTLTALRLVIADRLGIAVDHDESDIAESDDRYRVYEWLGHRLELLVHAADQLD